MDALVWAIFDLMDSASMEEDEDAHSDFWDR
jgi:hypothetical protein